MSSFATAAFIGLGSYAGALVQNAGVPMVLAWLAAGLFLGFAEVLSVAYIGSTMRDAVAFGLLFAVLLVRPKGLFGSLQERKV